MIRPKRRILTHVIKIVLLVAFSQEAYSAHGQLPSITDIAFAPDGKSLVSCSQNGIQIYSWPKLELTNTARSSFSNLKCLAFSPDGKVLAVGGGNPSEQGGVEFFSWPQCKSQMLLSNHDDSVTATLWLGNRNLVSASLDRKLTQWNLTTQKPIASYQGHSRGVTSVCALPNGDIASAGYDHSVRVWEIATGSLIRTLNQHSMPVNAIAMCPQSDGRPMIATAAQDRTIRFWQPTIGRMMRYIRLEAEPLDIAWVSATRIVASCNDGRVRLVDSDNVKVLKTISLLQGWCYAVAAHPNDRSIAIAGSDGEIRRFQIETSP